MSGCRAAGPGGCGAGSALRRLRRGRATSGEREGGRMIAPNFPALFSLLNRRSVADAKYQLLLYGANTCYRQMTELIESPGVVYHMVNAEHGTPKGTFDMERAGGQGRRQHTQTVADSGTTERKAQNKRQHYTILNCTTQPSAHCFQTAQLMIADYSQHMKLCMLHSGPPNSSFVPCLN